MPLLDLVTPWAAAVANGSDAIDRFQVRHAATLDRLRRRVTPDQAVLPLIPPGPALDDAATRAQDAATLDALDQVERAAADGGADVPHLTVLLPMERLNESMLALPGDPALLILSIPRFADNRELRLAKVRGQGLLSRWSAPDSASPVRTATHSSAWDHWELAHSIPLREWLYAAGVATHLAAAVLPEMAVHELLGIKRGELARLRERERALRDLVATELDHSGLGPLLRWLTPNTPAGLRTTPTQVIPPGAGEYLAWRMTAERVQRVGLREALRLTA